MFDLKVIFSCNENTMCMCAPFTLQPVYMYYKVDLFIGLHFCLYIIVNIKKIIF